MLSSACLYALTRPSRTTSVTSNDRCAPDHGASPMARTASLGDRPHVRAMSTDMTLITSLQPGYSRRGRPTANENSPSQRASLNPGQVK